MLKTMKIRIFPNKTQEKQLILMATGIDQIWNYFNEIQSKRILEMNPVKEVEKINKKGEKYIALYYDDKKKDNIDIPYKNGSIKTKYESAIIRWEVLTHFAPQYTQFGENINKLFGVPANSIGEICKQFNTNVKKYVKDSFNRYKEYKFKLKPRSGADWIPFRDGDIKLIDKKKIKFSNLEIKMSRDRRNLWNLANELDSRFYVLGDLKKCLRSGTITRSGGKWFLQVVMNIDYKKEMPKRTDGIIGLDPGLNTCITDSEGTQYKREDYSKFREKINDLKKKANKSKGGKARVVSKIDPNTKRNVSVKYSPSRHILKKVSRLEKQITEKKRHWEWGVAEKIASKGKNIVIGDLSIKAMAKMYGSSVGREAIFTLWNAIESKAKDYGLECARVSEKKTTLTCSNCGEETGPKGAKDIGMREWECTNCKTHHVRDVNAAINIAKFGEKELERNAAKIREEKIKEELKNKIFNKYIEDNKIENPKDYWAKIKKIKGIDNTYSISIYDQNKTLLKEIQEEVVS